MCVLGHGQRVVVANSTNGTIETRALWQAGADTNRMGWLYSFVWCLVVSSLLVFNRRFCTKPAIQVDDRDRVRLRDRSGI